MRAKQIYLFLWETTSKKTQNTSQKGTGSSLNISVGNNLLTFKVFIETSCHRVVEGSRKKRRKKNHMIFIFSILCFVKKYEIYISACLTQPTYSWVAVNNIYRVSVHCNHLLKLPPIWWDCHSKAKSSFYL